MALFKDTYRIESARLKEWDYSNPWWYYVTINTKDHIEWFGKILKEKMKLNKLGNLVEDEWLKTREIRKNVDLDYYVIMPNHIHGIIILENVETTGSVVSNNKENETIHPDHVGTSYIVSTTLRSNSLGSIIGQFKSVVTKQIRKKGFKNFSWQARYYDRIIRNEKELFHIRKYISENPLRWEIDNDVPENLEL